MKTCTKCEATKPLSDFHRDRKSPDGLASRCKACRLAVQAARRRRLATSGPTIARNEKWCPSCRRTLPADAFHSDRTRPDGLASRCKACILAVQAAYNRRWARENPDAKRALNARRRARKAAATVEDFSAADLATSWEERGLYACVYCGGPAEHADHVVPLSRGGAHDVGNLVPACAECNISKSARTLPEWRRGLWTAALAAARRTRSREAPRRPLDGLGRHLTTTAPTTTGDALERSGALPDCGPTRSLPSPAASHAYASLV